MCNVNRTYGRARVREFTITARPRHIVHTNRNIRPLSGGIENVSTGINPPPPFPLTRRYLAGGQVYLESRRWWFVREEHIIRLIEIL